MSWKDKIGLGGGSPEKQPDDPSSNKPERGKGFVARSREKQEEYKECVGLLQQFAEEGLKRAKHQDSSLDTLSLLDSAELKYKSPPSRSRIQIRVPGRDEAVALQHIINRALGVSEKESPLKRQECETVRNNKRTYRVMIYTDDYSAFQCKAALETTIRQLGAEPNWKSHYVEIDHAAEAEFRKTMREMEEDAQEGPKRDWPRKGDSGGQGRF